MSVWSVRVVKEEIGKRAFFLSLFSFRAASVPSVFLSAHFPAFPQRPPWRRCSSPLRVLPIFCLNSGRKDAALSLVGLCSRPGGYVSIIALTMTAGWHS